MSENNPTTWADGYGIWHASVPITGSRHADAMAARKAIMAEILARSPRGTESCDVRLSVTREHVTNHGTVVYKERSI